MTTTATKWPFLYTLLLLSLFLFVGSLLWLSFYNHPHTDDYNLGVNYATYGFIAYQKFIYLNWGGRYFTNVLGGAFANNNFLFSYYWFSTWFVVVTSVLACIYFIKTINGCWLENIYTNGQTILVGITLFVATTVCLVQTCTAFFWFSSSITYQFSFALLLIANALLLNIIHQKEDKFLLFGIFYVILVIAINGSNEVAALLNGFCLFAQVFGAGKFTPKQKKFLLFSIIIYFSSLLFSSFSPGNAVRASHLSEKNIIAIFINTFINTSYIFYNLFLHHLTWAILFMAFGLGISFSNKNYTIPKTAKSPIQVLLILISMVIVCILIMHLTLLYFSNGSLPERATNLFIQTILIILIMIVFYVGTIVKNNVLSNLVIEAKTIQITITILVVMIICNSTSKEIIKNTFSVKLYNSILTEREIALKQNTNKIVTINSYTKAAKENYNLLYGENQKVVIKQLIQQRPSLLFLFDDLENEKTIKELKRFYMKDSIFVLH